MKNNIAVQQVLEGMYQFSDNYNEHVKQLCYDASLIFKCKAEEIIST